MSSSSLSSSSQSNSNHNIAPKIKLKENKTLEKFKYKDIKVGGNKNKSSEKPEVKKILKVNINNKTNTVNTNIKNEGKIKNNINIYNKNERNGILLSNNTNQVKDININSKTPILNTEQSKINQNLDGNKDDIQNFNISPIKINDESNSAILQDNISVFTPIKLNFHININENNIKNEENDEKKENFKINPKTFSTEVINQANTPIKLYQEVLKEENEDITDSFDNSSFSNKEKNENQLKARINQVDVSSNETKNNIKIIKIEMNNYIETTVKKSNINKSFLTQDTHKFYSNIKDNKEKLTPDQINLFEEEKKEKEQISPIKSNLIVSQNYFQVDEKKISSIQTKEEVNSLFSCFDLNDKGYISALDIRTILIKYDFNFSDEEIDEMIRLCDINGDGQIGNEAFNEFLKTCIS